MPPEQLQTALRQQPFVPFRLHLTDGRSFDVPHPEMLLVAARVAIVGVNAQVQPNGLTFPERTETIALIHIVSLEPINQAV